MKAARYRSVFVLAIFTSLVSAGDSVAQAPPVKLRIEGFQDSNAAANEGEKKVAGDTDREFYPFKTKLCIRLDFDSGMVSTEPPTPGGATQPQPGGTESATPPAETPPAQAKKEPILYSTTFRRDGTVVLKRTDGTGFEVYPGGNGGAEIKSDGTRVEKTGRFEILPGGAVRETTTDGKVIIHYTHADGTGLRHGPGDSRTEILPNGTEIETLPGGVTIVRWPNGTGYIRYSDGKGAEIKPDGEMVGVDGTIEILPGGAIRQILQNEGAVLDRQPDGTMRSRPDLVKAEKQTSSATVEPVREDPTRVPRRQILLERSIAEHARLCNERLLDAVLKVDAATAGVPKLIAETAQVEEKKPGFLESLIPALIPSIGIGIGGGRGREGDRESPRPRDPRDR